MGILAAGMIDFGLRIALPYLLDHVHILIVISIN